MSVNMQEMINFHLTGKRAAGAAATDLPARTRPALLASYRDLTRLRYDFPLILVDDAGSQVFTDALSGVINRMLRDIAPPGNAGERLRQHVLRLEIRIRELVAAGSDGTVSELWKLAQRSLLAECDQQEVEALRNSLDTARFALGVDGHLIECDEHLPARLLQHAWAKREARRTKQSLEKITSLIIRLRNMIKVDDLKAGDARSPLQLKKTVGRRYKEAFDFELMSELLGDPSAGARLPPERRKRIVDALAVLESQQFFAGGTVRGRDQRAYGFQFDNLSAAIRAYDERLVPMTELVKAIAVAELECDNAYREDRHAPYFDRFGPQALSDEDVAMFPSYLVVVPQHNFGTTDTASLMEVTASDLPLKVLLQVEDAFGDPSPVDHNAHGPSSMQQLMRALVAPGSAHVVQAPASALFRQQDQIRRALEYAGPAVFSIYVPVGADTATVPAYLIAAAAAESRAFPIFSFDPGAGPELASRFDIGGNPQADKDWPQRELLYEDEFLQSNRKEIAFTPADFAVMIPRHSHHFAVAPRDSWDASLVPVADFVTAANSQAFDKVPYVDVIDADNRLQRLVVDDGMIRLLRRCRERWHTLQELARAPVPAAPPQDDATLTVDVDEPGAGSAETLAEETIESPPVEDAPQAEATPASDDPYIETPRCTTCDECTKRNDRMFAYDDNKQAYIKDPDAGTYRQLVEAAELCQVAIIHPGKPRNPDEPGLEELVKRAEPFQR